MASMAEGADESVYQREQEEQAQKERIIIQTSKLVRKVKMSVGLKSQHPEGAELGHPKTTRGVNELPLLEVPETYRHLAVLRLSEDGLNTVDHFSKYKRNLAKDSLARRR